MHPRHRANPCDSAESPHQSEAQDEAPKAVQTAEPIHAPHVQGVAIPVSATTHPVVGAGRVLFHSGFVVHGVGLAQIQGSGDGEVVTRPASVRRRPSSAGTVTAKLFSLPLEGGCVPTKVVNKPVRDRKGSRCLASHGETTLPLVPAALLVLDSKIPSLESGDDTVCPCGRQFTKASTRRCGHLDGVVVDAWVERNRRRGHLFGCTPRWAPHHPAQELLRGIGNRSRRECHPTGTLGDWHRIVPMVLLRQGRLANRHCRFTAIRLSL